MLTRILVGLVGIPVVVGIIGLGGWFFAGAVIVITTIALMEFYSLAASKDAKANVVVGVLWSISIQVSVTFLCGFRGLESIAWLLAAIGYLVGGVLLTLTAELWRNRENALVNTAMTSFGVMYVTLCMTALIVMRGMDWHDYEHITWFATPGAYLVLTMFISVWICDSVAYFVGKAIGRHKIFPRVSPNKSWEGTIGGMIGALVAFPLLASYFIPQIPVEHAIVCGGIVGVLGQVGDLAESLLKRDASIKDSSHIIPGHGGFFDRFDSILFVAPLILIYIQVMSHHDLIEW